MKLCKKCNAHIPNRTIIDKKTYNLQRRKYCFQCSPFKQHNTRQLHIKLEDKPFSKHGGYKNFTPEQKKQYNKLTYIRHQKVRRLERKKQLVIQMGGKCQICGYDKNIHNLCFHHKNPIEKKFELNNYSIGAKPWKIILEEAQKCELLCCLCHGDTHYPYGLNWQQ